MKTITFFTRLVLALMITILLMSRGSANNIQVTNVSLENLNESQNWVHVQFDVSWENSWRISAGPSNWDAAWLIIKYRANNGEWQHAQLAETDFTAPSGSTIEISPDNLGALIYRNADGSGDVDYPQVRLRWNYGSSVSTSDILDVQVFAMEMVYVPEGAFYLGTDNTDPNAEAAKFHIGGNINQPYQVTSESAITIANSGGNLYYQFTSGADAGDQTGTLSADFPKGFAAFYCLKYEVSQSQWVNYFNTLTPAQKTVSDVTGSSGKMSDALTVRNGISWEDTGNATTSHPDVALNYVSVNGALAFLDWAGLRPITELEYEKACRGPLDPYPGEFAWGNNTIAVSTYNFVNDGSPTESIVGLPENTGNAIYTITSGSFGPARNGIIPGSSVNHTREETGGSYYGIMELSGNLYERCVTVGNPVGRAFDGTHGDGTINPFGQHNITSWPDGASGTGIGYRGGSYANPSLYLRVSDRYDAANAISNGNSRLGFRGVRTAF